MSELRLAVERLESLVLAEETAPLNRSASEHLHAILEKIKWTQRLLQGKTQSKERELQIQELSSQTEDVIQSYRVLERSSQTWRFDNIKMIWLQKFGLSFTLRKIRSKIESISKLIELDPFIIVEDRSHVLQQINIEPIGLEEDQRKVCQLLLRDDDGEEEDVSSSSHIGVPVITICGVPSSGKTSLAELIFKDPNIAEKFPTRKWIDVHKFDIRFIHGQLIDANDKWMMPYISDEQMIERIGEILNSNRSLIVLDGIRSIEAWNNVCGVLPKLNEGNYVLVTTQVEHVAKYISQNKCVHNMKPLNEANSLALFTEVFSHRDLSANHTSSEPPLDADRIICATDVASTSASTKTDTRFEGHKCTTFKMNMSSAMVTDNREPPLNGDHISHATDEASTSSTKTDTRFEVHKYTTFNVNLSSVMETDNREPPLGGDRIIHAIDEATTSSTETDTRFEGHEQTTFNVNLSSAKEPDNREGELITEMVRCCDGSPQLIKKLALYLRSKKGEENIRACLSEFCCRVYNELPEYLQPCFMYLSHFLEDQEIDPQKLSHLWMIEGLLSTGQSTDITERYLRELELKCMVKVVEKVPATTKKFKACRFVQGMEYFCVPNSEPKRFLKVIDLREKACSLSSSAGPHRLVIYLGVHKFDISHEVAKKIRSLRVVLLSNVEQQIPEMLNLKEFGVLRILDFDGIDFQSQKLPRGTFNRKLLRYLSFKGCVLEELPSSITKLSFLQVLDLRVKEGPESVEIKIPNVLRKMRRLNHLYLPLKFATQNGKKLRLDSLTELETLVNFNTGLCRANDVLRLCKLRHLATKVEENFDDFESITNYMKISDSNKWPLHCTIDIINLDVFPEEMDSVLREFLRCKVLRTLQFKGCIGRLPPYEEISQNLTELVLNNSNLKEDPMPTLEKLPCLEILILSNNAYVGKKMFCSASGFPQLKCLQLLNLSFLQRVEVENTAMPILSNVEIKNCEKLEILRIR